MQVVHALALTYEVRSSDATSRAATFSIEAQNLTDTKAFDYFGVQRPGRAVAARRAHLTVYDRSGSQHLKSRREATCSCAKRSKVPAS